MGGEPDKVWWLGFDCAHYQDLIPGIDKHNPDLKSRTYKDLNYVKAGNKSLASQLKEMEENSDKFTKYF